MLVPICISQHPPSLKKDTETHWPLSSPLRGGSLDQKVVGCWPQLCTLRPHLIPNEKPHCCTESSKGKFFRRPTSRETVFAWLLKHFSAFEIGCVRTRLLLPTSTEKIELCLPPPLCVLWREGGGGGEQKLISILFSLSSFSSPFLLLRSMFWSKAEGMTLEKKTRI